jgi:hypothetical protein
LLVENKKNLERKSYKVKLNKNPPKEKNNEEIERVAFIFVIDSNTTEKLYKDV